MHIPAYQIHNVLKTYSLQLFKVVTNAYNSDSDALPSSGIISSETRREALIDKVASEIVQRITRLDMLSTRHSLPSPVSTSRSDSPDLELQHNQFVFQTLDIHNQKTPRSLSIEDSIFLIKRDIDSEPT